MSFEFLKPIEPSGPEQSLVYLLHKHMAGWQPGRTLAVLHASALTQTGNDEYCPRETCLRDELKIKPKDEYLSTSEASTYEMGHDQQDRLIGKFAEMERAITHWKCPQCGNVATYCRRPKICEKCEIRSKIWKPIEMRFQSALNGASMGLDIALDLGLSKYVPVEVKTMDKDQFKKLQMPLAEHRVRSQLYLRILAESLDPFVAKLDHKRIRVLYISKGGYGCATDELTKWGLKDQFSPFKEFILERDDETTETAWQKAKAVHEYRLGTAGMPDGICPMAFGKRAQACKVHEACWSGKWPIGLMKSTKEG